MTKPLRSEAYDGTTSVGALIVAGIIGAVIVLVIFAHAAGRVARYQGQNSAPVRWSLSTLEADNPAVGSLPLNVKTDPTVQQTGAMVGE